MRVRFWGLAIGIQLLLSPLVVDSSIGYAQGETGTPDHISITAIRRSHTPQPYGLRTGGAWLAPPSSDLISKRPGESTEETIRRILPSGSRLLHPVVSGEFGPGPGNAVAIFSDAEKGPYSAWVFVPRGDQLEKHVLPVPSRMADHVRWEPQAILFQALDLSGRAQLLIMSDSVDDSFRDSARKHYTWAYRWVGEEFMQVPEVTEWLGDAFPAQQVRARLAEVGLGPVSRENYPSGQPLSQNALSIETDHIERATSLLDHHISGDIPRLIGSEDARVQRLNAALKSVIGARLDEFESVLADRLANWPGGSERSSQEGEGGLFSTVGNLMSFQIEYYTFWSGTAHPYSWMETFNYDLATGQAVTLDQIFRPGFQYLDAISQYCLAELDRQGTLTFPEGAAPRADNYRLWNVSPDGLVITFNSYDVAPYAAGPQVVTIPYDALEGLVIAR